MSLRELRRHVGRLAVVGFSGHSVPAGLRDLAETFDLGGVIYFDRNIDEPRQLRELSREIGSLAREWPFWVSVDQEGGRVARLKAPFTTWPPAATMGRHGDEGLAEDVGRAFASELRAVGINLDYAPVLDVLTNSTNRVIGDRAFGDRPEEVARLGAAFVRGLQGAGVAACGKHFPGHGDTVLDSHEALPIVEHDRRRLDAVELPPFRRAIAEGVATIMTAHVLMPAFDEERPASLSPRIVQRMLKEDLGFEGVVLSDDLGMKAVSGAMGLAESTVAALVAGSDAVLMCNSTVDEQVTALEAIIHAAEDGRLSATRIDDAWARQRRVKERFFAAPGPAPALDRIGCDAHQALARQLASLQ